MSKTHYDWRKIEPVSMKAKFIHSWCLESEYIVKNQFHNWKCFENLGSFWPFSSTSLLAALENEKMCYLLVGIAPAFRQTVGQMYAFCEKQKFSDWIIMYHFCSFYQVMLLVKLWSFFMTNIPLCSQLEADAQCHVSA